MYLRCGEHLDQDLPSSEIRLGLKVAASKAAVFVQTYLQTKQSCTASFFAPQDTMFHDNYERNI